MSDSDYDRPFNLGEMRRCELQRNGLGPEPGHCKFCDRVISDSVEQRWDRRTGKMLAKVA